MKCLKFYDIKIGFIILFGIVSIFIENGMAQKNEKNWWNNKKCAVCLTYDDALNVHLDSVIPVLDSLGLKGTFYLSGNFQTVQERANANSGRICRFDEKSARAYQSFVEHDRFKIIRQSKNYLFSRRRWAEVGIRMASRYFATVRRAISMPSPRSVIDR